ncbi:MAG: ATP phosphoribosyltransferase [Bacteroidales bacterium]|nr:ATP phosphoribosyltransferase [Bacteroidales bacterium]
MIRIAIQTKGRLNEESLALMKSIDIDVESAKRKFLSKAANFPAEVLYLRDDDIPQVVSSGTAQLGIVGLNEVEERGCDVEIVARLGFGGCRISLAVPKGDKYEGVEYFNGKTIATSYPVILGKFLKENNIDAKIEVITGSVEIAPAAGIADAIFDIVSSGGTLVSNGLREVERVFESEAVLIANRNLGSEEREVLDEILFRIESERVSSRKKYLLMNIPKDSLDEALTILPAMRSPTVMPLAAEGWCSLHSVVEADELWNKVKQLKAIGAEGILVLTLDKIIL